MKKLAVFGASGHGRVVADVAECCGWQVVFFDDATPGQGSTLGLPYAGTFNDLLRCKTDFDGAFVAIGNNRIRLDKYQTLLAEGMAVPSLIHPSAIVSRHARVADASVIMPGAVVNAGACVGFACIVNTSASVDHDCVLEDGVHISPGARLAGEVFVGKRSWVGIGASVRQQVRIGVSAMVAAGAVVVKDVEDNATVAGVPAIRMR
ncbi:acetyltransferase [Pseudomonas daroniae]|uniref:Acetyltransferase n=1 Tax=Phytopseudomonas daroniae TaxID=2487519 RepID=A0A4Q9QP78_9GAMM|nr:MULTISPECIES: acetyltransferase [Pseudomonas]TBU81915.1 acetyltransferase [Pseudomonas daroniae]TBU84748.1 acetyltransferase [Pseudomonas sp. FRB 228]TBU92217.1 acetyltransferase [Pseudomonas daroniae]